MKILVTKPVELDLMAIRVIIPDRYEGQSNFPMDFPLRRQCKPSDDPNIVRHKYDVWDAVIDLDTGKVRQWPEGVTREFSMKVCDEGVYELYDQSGNEVAKIADYVPGCIPGKYGDYVLFQIGTDGVVADWKECCTAESIRDSFFRRED